MRWVLLWVTGVLLIAGKTTLYAEDPADVSLAGPTFKVGGLKFTVPYRWRDEPIENPSSRAGQWRVPSARGQEEEGGDVVVFYFGPGLGGSARENIEAWASALSNPDGHPVAINVKSRSVNGLKISEVALLGSYSRPLSVPGIPPEIKPDYGLLGAVIENPQGNVYWRFTGPESLATANLSLFDKIIDSVKPLEK